MECGARASLQVWKVNWIKGFPLFRELSRLGMSGTQGKSHAGMQGSLIEAAKETCRKVVAECVSRRLCLGVDQIKMQNHSPVRFNFTCESILSSTMAFATKTPKPLLLKQGFRRREDQSHRPHWDDLNCTNPINWSSKESRCWSPTLVEERNELNQVPLSPAACWIKGQNIPWWKFHHIKLYGERKGKLFTS